MRHKVRKMVWVTFRLEGFHHWPDAPSERRYLASQHRHMFHYKVGLSVNGLNREIEFHTLLDEVKSRAEHFLRSQTSLSCEQLAVELAHSIAEDADNPLIEVTVSEDGECGATVVLEGEIAPVPARTDLQAGYGSARFAIAGEARRRTCRPARARGK